MAVEASVVIDFGDADEDSVSGIILVELDDQHPNNLDAEGNTKSSFAPEEEPVFLIHHDDTIEVTRVDCTDGRVYSVGTNQVRSRPLDALFTKPDAEISLSYYNIGDLEETWYGNIGAYHLDSAAGKLVSDTGGTFPSYCSITFNVNFQQQWRLVPPPLTLEDDESYTIYVVVYVREVV